MALKITPEDKVFSQFIRMRAMVDSGGCEYCGRQVESYKQLQCSHFVGRRYQNTRFEPDNACGLCYTCHNLFHDFSSINQDFFTKRIGTKRMEELEVVARTIKKMTKERREAIKADLKEKIKRLEQVSR